MRIAIDLDGTALYHVEFFSSFMKAMMDAGHEVGILTSHGEHEVGADLKILEEKGFPFPNFFIFKTKKEKEKYKPHVGNNGLWKADMVEKYNIDYHIGDLDGNDVYVEHFIKQHPHKLIRVWGDK